MSWGEVEKINSWAKKGVPLNHLIWLNDYKTYGQKSYVCKNKDILHELYRSPICANDEAIQIDAFNYVASEQEHYLGLWLSKNYGLKDVANLSNCKSISDLISDTDVLNQISLSEFADAFFNLEKVIAYFVTTEGLKAASALNNVMNVLEKTSSFKAAVASNPDIQTITRSMANNASETVVENAYIISVSANIGVNGANHARGSISCVPNGSADNVILVSSATGNNVNRVNNQAVHQFVKSLTFGGPAYYGPLENSVTYIQLDNVV